MLIIFWFSINLFRLIDLWLMMHKFWRFRFKSTQFFAFTRLRIANPTKKTYKRSSLWYKRQFIPCNLSRNCLRGGENKLHGTRLLGALTSPEMNTSCRVSQCWCWSQLNRVLLLATIASIKKLRYIFISGHVILDNFLTTCIKNEIHCEPKKIVIVTKD